MGLSLNFPLRHIHKKNNICEFQVDANFFQTSWEEPEMIFVLGLKCAGMLANLELTEQERQQ